MREMSLMIAFGQGLAQGKEEVEQKGAYCTYGLKSWPLFISFKIGAHIVPNLAFSWVPRIQTNIVVYCVRRSLCEKATATSHTTNNSQNPEKALFRSYVYLKYYL